VTAVRVIAAAALLATISGVRPCLTFAQAGRPAGSGASIAIARCVSCHEADLIAPQRLSSAGWTREIDKMVRWGAQVTDEEREPLITYLATHFVTAPIASRERMAEGETVYRNACLTCHEADLIASQRLSRAGWTREIDKMIRWGAQVSDPGKEPLVDYLASGGAKR
jgi:cytochrome c5